MLHCDESSKSECVGDLLTPIRPKIEKHKNLYDSSAEGFENIWWENYRQIICKYTTLFFIITRLFFYNKKYN